MFNDIAWTKKINILNIIMKWKVYDTVYDTAHVED